MKALANNFGVAEIEFRSWQEKGLVILNGVVSIDTENESYKAAEVLEITVPDLSISRSAVALHLWFLRLLYASENPYLLVLLFT